MKKNPFIEKIHSWHITLVQNIINLSDNPIDIASKTAQKLLYRSIISGMMNKKGLDAVRCRWILDIGYWIIDDFILKICEDVISRIEMELADWNLKILPYEFLSDIYENYLTKRLIFNSSGYIELQPEDEFKKGRGIYYTPRDIVEFTVDHTLGKYLWGTENGKRQRKPPFKNLDDIRSLQILDPACGSGSFLAYAFDLLFDFYAFYIPDRPSEWVNAILENHLYGIDTDIDALNITSAILMLKYMEISEIVPQVKPKLNINHGSFLTIESDNNKFAMIIGNPPYGIKLNEDEKSMINSCYELCNPPDISCLFLEKSVKMLKENGMLGFVMPKSLTYVNSWQTVREFLLSGCKIIGLADAKKGFEKVRLEEIVLITEKSNHSNAEIPVYILDSSSSWKKSHNIHASALKHSIFSMWISTKGIEDILGKIWEVSVPLAELAEIWNGLNVPKQVLLFDSPNGEDRRLCLRGRDIQRYYIKPEHKYISLEYIKDKKRLKLDRFLRPKIVVQDIVAYIKHPIPRIKLMAALDDSNKWVNINTVTNIASLEYELEYLCGILNSQLISWYTHNFIYNRAIRTMHFRVGYADHIPIPRVNLDDSEFRQIYEKLIVYVKQMISLYKKNSPPKYKTAKLDREIENLICRLYRITDEDLKIIREI